jgi:hypothetical protein
MMLSQYAADMLIVEQRILSAPASTMSIPAAADQEDFVSMGMNTALKNRQILENAYAIVGIELMAAAQAWTSATSHRARAFGGRTRPFGATSRTWRRIVRCIGTTTRCALSCVLARSSTRLRRRSARSRSLLPSLERPGPGSRSTAAAARRSLPPMLRDRMMAGRLRPDRLEGGAPSPGGRHGTALAGPSRERGSEVDLGEFLWAILVFFFWFMAIWIFIAIFGDIFRREDLSGWGKAGWIFLIFVVPFLGALIYVIARPKMTEQDRRMAKEAAERERRLSGYSAADELAKLAKLRDAGELTAEEYEEMKRRAMIET